MPAYSDRKRLLHKIQWTYQVEGMNAVMFLGISIFCILTFGFTDLIFFTYGILFSCYILMQGTYYWWLKYTSLKGEPIPQTRTLDRFKQFKATDHIGMLLIPVVLLLQWFISGKQLNGNNLLGWALFANFFAVLEYINYYQKQLMYDNQNDFRYLKLNRKLKEASLHKDLRENKI